MTTPRRTILAGLASAAALGSRLFAQSPQPTASMPADPPRELKPQQGANEKQPDLGTLFPAVQQLAEANKYEGSFLSGQFASFADFQKSMRQKVFDCLLYRPEPVAPRPEIIEKVDMGDHTRERILFSTSPQFRVPAYVLVPKGLTKPAPAIVDLHSHGGMFIFGKEKVINLGNNHPVMTEYHQKNYDGRPTATELVRRGYVVISIDAFMFGERRILLDSDYKHGWDRSAYSYDIAKQLNMVCRSKESTIVKGLTFAGLTWPGVVFWDDIRTVDYLVTRPDVDPQRIGCVGISMGGYRSLYLAALDERIKAGCVVGFMSSVKPMIRGHLDTHSFVHFLPGLHQLLDLPDVATLAAGRNLMVQQCRRDGLFPLAGMEDSIATIKAAFEKNGRGQHFAGPFYDEPHRYSVAMQEEAFQWFKEKL